MQWIITVFSSVSAVVIIAESNEVHSSQKGRVEYQCSSKYKCDWNIIFYLQTCSISSKYMDDYKNK